jgi:TonB family protein
VRTYSGRFTTATFGVVLLAVIFANVSAPAQEEEAPARKVVNRVVPNYPEMARVMNLKGSVKVDALVAANGTVKTVVVKGGNPVLVQAAENAIRKWKWQPAAHETVEPVEFKFDPRTDTP